jgi:hypothetical protein
MRRDIGSISRNVLSVIAAPGPENKESSNSTSGGLMRS